MYDLSKLCVFDLEADFERGLDVWSKHYKLVSAAFLIVVEGKGSQELFTDDVEEIYAIIEECKAKGYTFVCHNLNYEGGVLLGQRGIDITSQTIDTLRLHQHTTQYNDNRRSLALTAATREYIGLEDYKAPYLQYLINNGMAKNSKDAHAKVGSLPIELLKEYNLADVRMTYEVFRYCVNYLEVVDYNWEFDQVIYTSDVRRNLKSYIKGIRVDRDLAASNLRKLMDRREELELNFYRKYASAIIEAEKILSGSAGDKSYEQRKEKAKNPDKIERKEVTVSFNMNSTKHKIVLALEVLGHKPYLFTDKGAASFNAKHLHQYGELGRDLVELAKLRKPIEELEKVIALSKEDGRLHLLVKTGTTVTGRSTSGK